jgi:hypothetical protein
MTTYVELVAEKATGRVTGEVGREIEGLAGDGGVISAPAQLRTDEYEGLTAPLLPRRMRWLIPRRRRSRAPTAARDTGADRPDLGRARRQTILNGI